MSCILDDDNYGTISNKEYLGTLTDMRRTKSWKISIYILYSVLYRYYQTF